MKITILIRVYDRLVDLEHCLEIIRKTWKNFDYYVLVMSNGKNNGFIIDNKTKKLADRVIELEENAGHLKGNAQLLQEGLKYIPSDSAYTIILEADTWIFTDQIIKKYITQMELNQSVWASAQWYKRFHSLATDFAIIKTEFLLKNKDIFEYTGFPECYAANFIMKKNYKFSYILENMPVHVPQYIKNYPFAPKGRFYIFPKSGMITHHIEELKGGMEEKKYCFNSVSGQNFFNTSYNNGFSYKKYIEKLNFAVSLSKLFPDKSWFFKIKNAIIN